MPTRNLHATAILIADRGVLIRGASGSGKSTLALALLSRPVTEGRFAALVGDDRLLVRAVYGRLQARAPATIGGLIEVHGLGPRSMRWEPSALIDLVVDLVGPEHAPRYQEEASAETIDGIALPRMMLAERNTQAAAAAILARLRLPPFL